MSDPLMAGAEAVSTRPSEVTSPETPPSTQPETKRERSASLWSDAWRDLRRRPIFIISAVLIIVVILMAAFPQLFTSKDPTAADLSKNLDGPNSSAWFGYDIQGYDVYSRTIYGARTSIIVGLLSVIGATLLGGTVGMLAGYYGRWLDALLSRLGDVFFGLPFVLGAIVILSTFASQDLGPAAIVGTVVLTFVALVWPQYARIMRSSVISNKHADYVQAARALGAGPLRIMFRHLLPNCMAPIIVIATISLGAYIGAEATLSYLGIGLRAPVISWGVAIADNKDYLSVAPHALLFPAAFLSITVLSFVMLGDAVRDALDPKLR